MYKIFADDTLIYDSTLDDYVITKGVVDREVNKSGSFVFSMYQDNPFIDKIHKLKTIIKVYKYNRLIFRGRVITEQQGFYNDKTFTCEGELSFLLDSIQRPYQYTGAPDELFTQFINNHNDQVDEVKRFEIGEITVTDTNDYINRSNTEYEDTLTNINNHLVEHDGGYLHITRGDNEVPRINWFEDFPYKSGQKIEFGENLLDFTKTNSAVDIATAIIPLGAKLGEGADAQETRVTIESVNNGLDYIVDDLAVATYGLIFKVVTFDNVTEPSNLLNNARQYLTESINQNITIELSAIDLSLLDYTIDSFKLGDYIDIESKPHGVEDTLLLQKQSIDLLKPDNDTITLGYTYSTFTDKTISSNTQNETLVKTVASINNTYTPASVVNKEVETLRSLIDQTSTSISTEVLSEYALNDDVTLAISTLYEQFDDMFQFNFKTLETTVNENDTEARRQFREISQYIRFKDGNIILGESENELTLEIKNDRIAFLEAGVEVAYFSNHKFYITDIEVLQSIKIGQFAFTPRDNGSLSFGKIGG